jgi:hypothetical protein
MEAASFARAVQIVLNSGAEEFKDSREELSYQNQMSYLHEMLNSQSNK